MNIIKRRQLESRLALNMEKMSKKKNSNVTKTKDGYVWKDEKGNTLVTIRNF